MPNNNLDFVPLLKEKAQTTVHCDLNHCLWQGWLQSIPTVFFFFFLCFWRKSEKAKKLVSEAEISRIPAWSRCWLPSCRLSFRKVRIRYVFGESACNLCTLLCSDVLEFLWLLRLRSSRYCHRHSRPQRPLSFRSAPRIATSGQVQHRKSAIHGLPVTLRMLRIKPDKSDWFWSQSIVFTKPFKSGMSLDLARGHDSWCWPKGARPLGTRMKVACEFS